MIFDPGVYFFNNRSILSAAINSAANFTNAYQYDPLGEMTQVSQSGSALTAKQANFTYNALGQFTSMSLSASSGVASAAYGYDQTNRLADAPSPPLRMEPKEDSVPVSDSQS